MLSEITKLSLLPLPLAPNPIIAIGPMRFGPVGSMMRWATSVAGSVVMWTLSVQWFQIADDCVRNMSNLTT